MKVHKVMKQFLYSRRTYIASTLMYTLMAFSSTIVQSPRRNALPETRFVQNGRSALPEARCVQNRRGLIYGRSSADFSVLCRLLAKEYRIGSRIAYPRSLECIDLLIINIERKNKNLCSDASSIT